MFALIIIIRKPVTWRLIFHIMRYAQVRLSNTYINSTYTHNTAIYANRYLYKLFSPSLYILPVKAQALFYIKRHVAYR